MIISASRRTDIPAFFGEWFMNRLREGAGEVPNPWNPRQVSRVSLARDDVDFIVFWTRFPSSLMPHLGELADRGYPFYVQFTLLDYPPPFEPHLSPLKARLDLFHALARTIGPERVLWRYDPVIIRTGADAAFHERTFTKLARELSGSTRRCTVSLLDEYRGMAKRMEALGQAGFGELPGENEPAALTALFERLAAIALEHGMETVSCAEPALRAAGIRHGACVDAELASRLFGTAPVKKDPGQRTGCLCALSRDIGVYGTCRFGCIYCYASHRSGSSPSENPL